MNMKPQGVLILSNDLLTPFAKTSDYLAEALHRQGIPAYVRDNADARMLTHLFTNEMESEIPKAVEAISHHFRDLIQFAGIDTVMSLDMNWLVVPDLYLRDSAIRSVHSLWFDDFRSWCTSCNNTCFQLDGNQFQAHVRHPKVTHHFYGNSQAMEARILGVHGQRITRLAAPLDLIKTNDPCVHTHKLAFIGNPGFRGTPHPKALELMEQGADLDELRKCVCDATLNHPDAHLLKWYREEPTIIELIRVALEARRKFPYQPALQILQMAGQHHPRAFEYANEKGIILDVAFLIKLVNRYDRPAFVQRLWKRGWVDVYSAANEWSPYGVTALPYLSFRELPSYYRMYAAHLNAPNSIRDATANEKLFEIAACGRLSINLASPDVRSCYAEGEIWSVNSLDELEEAAHRAITNPELALQCGQKARLRTAREHLWDHRLSAILSG